MHKIERLLFVIAIISILLVSGITGCNKEMKEPVETPASVTTPDTAETSEPVTAPEQEESSTPVTIDEQEKNSETLTTPEPETTRAYDLTYVIVDTGQDKCYDNSHEIASPQPDQALYGQDAQYQGTQPDYRNNGDGTVTDLNTGLMWQRDPGEKMTYFDAVSGAESFSLAGYNDWRLPTIKELYSLIIFSGTDVNLESVEPAIPFIDTDYFDFEYGDTSAGERIIDSQFVSSTKYVSTTMQGNDTVFGVNFADGRIKGYPTKPMRNQSGGKTFFVLYVRSNSDYGVNSFVDNSDGTITDTATGMMWSQADSAEGMDWEDALAWVQQKNTENYLGYSDWRLPDAKELHSIVDYTRSPDTTDSAAIDPLFEVSEITNEAGVKDYPFYWTGTTHVKSNGMGNGAAYISFGRALGYMNNQWLDVHGAGAQRSDPKSGSPDDYPTYFGPQGDVRRLFNYVRCVRSDSGTWGQSSIRVTTNSNGVQEGLTLFAPIGGTTAYLIDLDGNPVHQWQLSGRPGHAVYLLEDGRLLATYTIGSDYFKGAGVCGGGIEIIDWDGDQVWSYDLSDSTYHLHHDIESLPNGNILAIAWEKIPESEALSAEGYNSYVSSYGEVWSEAILEIDPDTDSIVWEWHAWDHLLPFGTYSEDYPELIDPNYPIRRQSADWLHINSVDYNEALDQIMMSVHNTNEIWIINHNTSTSEAAGSQGDLLYRWGNPEAFGESGKQVLYAQHDAKWIYPESASSNIILFNNGNPRLRPYSNVLELKIYPYSYGEAEIIWEYGSSSEDESFFSSRISGAQRLANGNTLICSGTEGWFFEVTSDGKKIWEYANSYGNFLPNGKYVRDVFRAERYSYDSE